MSETQLPRNMFGLSDVRCRREAGLTLDCPREASCEFILVVILSAAAKRSEYHCILQSELEQITSAVTEEHPVGGMDGHI